MLTDEIEEKLKGAGVVYTEELVEHLAQLLSNSVECANCDGHCCTGFSGIVPHDKKSWSRTRATKLVLEQTDWLRDGEPCIVDGEVFVPCACKHWVDGKCSIYDGRPVACQLYPLPRVLRGEVYEGCALARAVDDLLIVASTGG